MTAGIRVEDADALVNEVLGAAGVDVVSGIEFKLRVWLGLILDLVVEMRIALPYFFLQISYQMLV